MIQTIFSGTGSDADGVVRDCIERLVARRLTKCKCPGGCPANNLAVEVRGNWREGDFELYVVAACCGAHVVSANELLRGGRARNGGGFLAAA